ncbi:DUF6188 family protein [Streptomyces syringium]|uniref:DUF6188 family protein n=1 Tax=Streptomyces syringium TaxID=76729 RepID=UPI0034398198
MIEELKDRWILGLRGTPVATVFRTSEGNELRMLLAGGTELKINGAMRLTYGAATSPQSVPLTAEELDGLVGATIASAVAFKSGSLRVVFGTGHHLNVPGGEHKAAAHIRKPGDFDWSGKDGVGTMEALW